MVKEAMPGRKLNHYIIESELGHGGMGDVYIATDDRLKRKVALKVFRPELAQDPDRLKRFEREVKTLASLNHPHIVTIYSVEEAEGLHFFTMELVRGKKMSQLIPQEGIPLQAFFHLILPLTDALRVAHGQGITHRDLKPDNIIVGEDGRPKILDFGLAKLREGTDASAAEIDINTDSMTGEGVVIGTVAYMSPEQAQGRSVDPRSDIFSLGILLYQMITGHHPFQGENNIELLSSILKDTPKAITDYNKSLPSSLWTITRKCLDKDPLQRYQSTSDLHDDLTNLKKEFDSGDLEPLMSVECSGKTRNSPSLGRPFIYSFALFLIIIFLFAAVFFQGKRKTVIDTPVQTRPTVAVLNFEDLTGTAELQWLQQGLPGMLMTGLAQTPGLNVISSQRIHELFKNIVTEGEQSVNRATIAEISQQSGATIIIFGSIYRIGPAIRIDAQIEDVASGHLITAHNVQGTDIFALVDQLVERIKTSLNLDHALNDKGISDITTDSLKAYQLYTEGLEAKMNFRWKAAYDLFLAAVELDPNFAMAYFELSRLAGLWKDGQVKEHQQLYRMNVLDNLERLPERQKLLVQGVYALDRIHTSVLVEAPFRDPQKARSLLEELIAKYPDEEEAYILLATLYVDHFQDEELGLDLLRKGVFELPKSGPLRNYYAYFLQIFGKYTEAFQSLHLYAELQPDEPNPYDSLAEAYLKTGQPEKALEYYNRALDLDPTFSSSFRGRMYTNAMLGHYDKVIRDIQTIEDSSQGYNEVVFGPFFANSVMMLSSAGVYSRAVDIIQTSLSAVRNKKTPYEEAWFLLVLATIYLDHQRPLDARPLAAEAVGIMEKTDRGSFKSLVPILSSFIAGISEAHAGFPQKAREHLENMKKLKNEKNVRDVWWIALLEAEVKLAEGDLQAALVAFEQAEPDRKIVFMPNFIDNLFVHQLPFRDGIARVKTAMGDYEGALSAYQRLLKPDISDKLVSPLTPRFVLNMARLYERLGRKDEARASYQRFLALWADADPDLPERIEAQQYLRGEENDKK